MEIDRSKQELEEMYGPGALYSEHQVGETISFREDGETKTGCIIYVQAPGAIRGKPYPTTYLVETAESDGGMPSIVFPGQVLTIPS
jgi:hypothetical protein